MRNFSVKLLFPAIFFSLALTNAVFAQEADVQARELEAWIKPYRANLANRGYAFPNSETDEEGPMALISVITEDNRAQFPLGGKYISSYVLKNSGEIEWTFQHPMGSRGGCCSNISADDLTLLKKLLAKLPAGDRRLPSNERRLLVQKPGVGEIDVRVFDLAFLPDAVLELLRVAQTNIKTYVPSFDPQLTVEDMGHSDLRGFAVAGDGRFAVTTRGSGALRVRQFLTTKGASEVVEEIKLPQNSYFQKGISISPDDSTLIAGGWGEIMFFDTREWRVVSHFKVPDVERRSPDYTRYRFIERGKYLLFDGGGFGTRVFETGSWQEVKKPASIPNDALFYLDSPDARRAVFQLDKKLYLRRVDRKVGTLFSLGEDDLITASFSPDGTRVAIVTAGSLRRGDSSRRLTRIRIWDANELSQTHELMPFEQDLLEEVYGIDWTDDGKYILAAARPNWYVSVAGIEIWDASSGRHMGELSGCVGALSGMTRLSDGKIAAGCSDGKIRIWDLAASLREIEKFRRSGTGSEK